MTELKSETWGNENQLDDEKSALGGLTESDYKTWHVNLLRFSTGSAEAFKEGSRGVEIPLKSEFDGLIIEAFGELQVGILLIIIDCRGLYQILSHTITHAVILNFLAKV